MAYTVKNYRTKKELVTDFKAGKAIEVYAPGPFGPDVRDGSAVIEGPHYPEPHKFYVQVTVTAGYITAVKR